jgi:5,10-methenyltetrahydrofolate synthetase
MYNSLSNIRKTILEKRVSMNKNEVNKLSNFVIDNLKKINEINEANCILGYYPIKNEVNILPFLKSVSLNKTVCLPYSLKKERNLICIKVKNWNDFIHDPHGIPAPNSNEIVEPEKIDVALIPAIAFDLKGYRLGYGFGYYDNFSSNLKRALKIGIVFDFQIIEEINNKGMKVDILVSEKRLIKIQ